MRAIVVLLVVLGTAPLSAADTSPSSSTARHLLAGVRSFKDGKYEDALVELRVVARAPDAPADLAFYLGPTLYKLGRYREALAVFVSSKAAPDALTDFYLGQTYYQLKLYRKARGVFASLQARGLGPVLETAAASYVEAVDTAYRKPPEVVTIDSYIDTGRAALANEPTIAAEYLDEARLVEALGSAHRHDELRGMLGAAWNATGRTTQVIEILGDGAGSAEVRWQLARAYVTSGDAAHARPILDALVKARGPHAEEASGVLAKLPP